MFTLAAESGWALIASIWEQFPLRLPNFVQGLIYHLLLKYGVSQVKNLLWWNIPLKYVDHIYIYMALSLYICVLSIINEVACSISYFDIGEYGHY